MSKSLLFLTGLAIILNSCKEITESLSTEDLVFTEANSPYHITEHIETAVGQAIIIQPGARLIISDSINIIAFGDVTIKGTEEKPITIEGQSSVPGWGYFKMKNETKNFIMEYTTVKDGVFTSYNTNNYLNEVTFINNQNLNWQWAVARFWFGQVHIENCRITGVNKVEGFLLHDVNDPIIKDNHFDKIPDAVEFINCDRGEITNNVMMNSIDDGIDLNGCNNTVIKDNKISNYKNSGIEIGSENFGRSSNILVEENVIISCDIGFYLKESSTATFKSNQLTDINVALDISTPKDSTIITTASMDGNNYERAEQKIKKDERSVVTIINE